VVIRRTLDGGARVSALAIGCGRVGSISNATPVREIDATLEAAVEAGINLFDTADIYGQGDSERTLGRLLRRHPEDVFVVTKVGGRHGRCSAAARFAKPLLRALARSRPTVRNTVLTARTATVVHDFSPTDLRPAVEASRRRLGLDQLHGLLLHSPSSATLRKPEIHEFLDEMLTSRKAARVGVSVDTLDALEAAISISSLTLIQAPLEIVGAAQETPILDGLRRRGVAVFVREILRKPSRRTDDSRPASPAAALSAALAPDFVTSVIVGVSTRSHLAELLQAVA
jgi:aryl-alcohol dehydrogenase-like predicted oxidoreductase